MHLGLLYAHGSLVEQRAQNIIFRVGGAFVGVAGLSATGAEDGSPLRGRLVHINGQSRGGLGIADGPLDGPAHSGCGIATVAFSYFLAVAKDTVIAHVINQQA